MPAVRTRLAIADEAATRPDFSAGLARHGLAPLTRAAVTTLQVNVGKRCNQACHHCHVEAGPARTEIMAAEVADQVLAVLAAHPQLATLDLTGGAPELNPGFGRLVAGARRLGRRVIDRCNLTVLFEPGMADLAEFLADHDVEVVASLPCYLPGNVEDQRGRGVFAASIAALRRLNALGYGHAGSPRALHLVYNPGGAFLPPAQAALEATYRDRLRRDHGVEFHRLYTITNMPIARFADQLITRREHAAYMSLLVNHLNPATIDGVMCRELVSVGWDGRLYDCDFNQMLEVPLGAGTRTIDALVAPGTLDALVGAPIATASHCFACTAGAGSSCGGAWRDHPAIAILGGSGFYDLPGASVLDQRVVDTPFGAPSDALTIARLGDRRVIFLARHGRGHTLLPGEINARANLYALKLLGATHVISVSAVGSLRAHIAPGDVVVPRQLLDRTVGRPATFFGGGVVAHVSLADPICDALADGLVEAARPEATRVHPRGTYVCIEGPQFGTRAEAELLRTWGADVVGMTNLPEARLAREAELCYATLALPTDHDCWRARADEVRVADVLGVLRANVETARRIVARAVAALDPARACRCQTCLDTALVTPVAAIAPASRARLEAILARRLEVAG